MTSKSELENIHVGQMEGEPGDPVRKQFTMTHLWLTAYILQGHSSTEIYNTAFYQQMEW